MVHVLKRNLLRRSLTFLISSALSALLSVPLLIALPITSFSTPALKSANSSSKSAAGEATILIIGDSLTEGFGIEKSKAYPAVLESLLNKAKTKGSFQGKWKVINAGQSGWTSASGLSQLKWQLKSKVKPSLLVLALGANDGLRGLSPEATKKNLASVIQLAKKENMKVVLAGMMAPPNYGKKYTEDFKRIYTDLAREEKIDLVPFLLEGVAGEKNLNLEDGIHPNEQGHLILAETVYRTLRKHTGSY